MEQHGRELDEQDDREEEHEDEADRLQLQIGDSNLDLRTKGTPAVTSAP